MSTAISLPLAQMHQPLNHQEQHHQFGLHHSLPSHSLAHNPHSNFFDRRNDLLPDVGLFHDPGSNSPIDEHDLDLDHYPLTSSLPVIEPPELNFAPFHTRPQLSRQITERARSRSVSQSNPPSLTRRRSYHHLTSPPPPLARLQTSIPTTASPASAGGHPHHHNAGQAHAHGHGRNPSFGPHRRMSEFDITYHPYAYSSSAPALASPVDSPATGGPGGTPPSLHIDPSYFFDSDIDTRPDSAYTHTPSPTSAQSVFQPFPSFPQPPTSAGGMSNSTSSSSPHTPYSASNGGMGGEAGVLAFPQPPTVPSLGHSEAALMNAHHHHLGYPHPHHHLHAQLIDHPSQAQQQGQGIGIGPQSLLGLGGSDPLASPNDDGDRPWDLVPYHVPWGSSYVGYKAGTLPGPEGKSIFLRSPTPTKNQRTSQACEKCRERKAKCSGARPSCARCIARGHVCEYGPEIKKAGTNTNGANSGANVGSAPEVKTESASSPPPPPSPVETDISESSASASVAAKSIASSSASVPPAVAATVNANANGRLRKPVRQWSPSSATSSASSIAGGSAGANKARSSSFTSKAVRLSDRLRNSRASAPNLRGKAAAAAAKAEEVPLPSLPVSVTQATSPPPGTPVTSPAQVPLSPLSPVSPVTITTATRKPSSMAANRPKLKIPVPLNLPQVSMMTLPHLHHHQQQQQHQHSLSLSPPMTTVSSVDIDLEELASPIEFGSPTRTVNGHSHHGHSHHNSMEYMVHDTEMSTPAPVTAVFFQDGSSSSVDGGGYPAAPPSTASSHSGGMMQSPGFEEMGEMGDFMVSPPSSAHGMPHGHPGDETIKSHNHGHGLRNSMSMPQLHMAYSADVDAALATYTDQGLFDSQPSGGSGVVGSPVHSIASVSSVGDFSYVPPFDQGHPHSHSLHHHHHQHHGTPLTEGSPFFQHDVVASPTSDHASISPRTNGSVLEA